jgi:hypothetical protein
MSQVIRRRQSERGDPNGLVFVALCGDTEVLGASVDEENLRAVTKAASIRFSERLAEAGIQPSVGAVGNPMTTRWPSRSTVCTKPS